jgi:UDP-glucose 4-epimerase
VNLLKGKYVFIPKRPGEPDITHADIKKIKKYLQWKPKISIKKKENFEDLNLNEKNYFRNLRNLWNNFSVKDLQYLKDECDNNLIKNIIQKMNNF